LLPEEVRDFSSFGPWRGGRAPPRTEVVPLGGRLLFSSFSAPEEGSAPWSRFFFGDKRPLLFRLSYWVWAPGEDPIPNFEDAFLLFPIKGMNEMRPESAANTAFLAEQWESPSFSPAPTILGRPPRRSRLLLLAAVDPVFSWKGWENLRKYGSFLRSNPFPPDRIAFPGYLPPFPFPSV